MRTALKTLTAVVILSILSLSMSGCLGGTGQAKNVNQTGNVTYYPDGYYDSYGFWHSYYHNHWYDRYFYDDYYGSSYPRSYSAPTYVTPSTKSYKTVTAEKNNIISSTPSTSSNKVKPTTPSTPSKTQTQKVDLKKSGTNSMKTPSKPVSRTYKSSSYSSSSRRR